MYAMHCTRPNIMFIISKLSRYTHNPSVDHWKGIIRILRYLKSIKSFGLFYNKFPSVLKGYNDASWNTSIINNKPIFKRISTLKGSAISWAFRKQMCITHSTIKSKFITLAIVGKVVDWL